MTSLHLLWIGAISSFLFISFSKSKIPLRLPLLILLILKFFPCSLCYILSPVYIGTYCCTFSFWGVIFYLFCPSPSIPSPPFRTVSKASHSTLSTYRLQQQWKFCWDLVIIYLATYSNLKFMIYFLPLMPKEYKWNLINSYMLSMILGEDVWR